MKLNKTLIAVATCAALLTACADTEEQDTGLLDGSQNAASGINDASTSGLDTPYGVNGAEMGGGYDNYRSPTNYGDDTAARLGSEFTDPSNPLSKRTIYFTLDSSEVLPDFIPVIAAHSRYLIANPSQRIILEGHCDERGSREYNIALGEQRAKSVAEMMKLQGVPDSQIQIVSFGEEKPAVYGNDESAWEQNRRVVVDYLSR